MRFVFGLDVTAGQHVEADDLPDTAWKPLKRPANTTASGPPRARPVRVKQQIVEQRGFQDIRLVDEEVAERPYRPTACRTTYRLVIVRKNLQVSEPRQGALFEDYRYSASFKSSSTRPTQRTHDELRRHLATRGR